MTVPRIAVVLGALLWAASARAKDPCAALFTTGSVALDTSKCDEAAARRTLAATLTPACRAASDDDPPPASIARLVELASLPEDPRTTCAHERHQLMIEAVCSLRPRSAKAAILAHADVRACADALLLIEAAEHHEAERERAAARSKRRRHLARQVVVTTLGVGLASAPLAVAIATHDTDATMALNGVSGAVAGVLGVADLWQLAGRTGWVYPHPVILTAGILTELAGAGAGGAASSVASSTRAGGIATASLTSSLSLGSTLWYTWRRDDHASR